MNPPRVVYRSMLEALYERALGSEITPALKQRLRPLGLDLDRPLPTSLPVPVYARCIVITVEELFPDFAPEAGMTELARRLTRAHSDSLVGRATLGLVRRLGPDRMLRWIERIFRAVDSYSSVSVVREGPNCFLVRTNAEAVPPGYGKGVFEELLRMAGAEAPEVEELGEDRGGDVFRVRWSEAPGG